MRGHIRVRTGPRGTTYQLVVFVRVDEQGKSRYLREVGVEVPVPSVGDWDAINDSFTAQLDMLGPRQQEELRDLVRSGVREGYAEPDSAIAARRVFA